MKGYRAKHYTADYKKIGMNFEYVATNVPGPNTDTGAWELLACCDCTSECSAEQKCTCLLGAEDNYSIDGLFLEKSSGAPILECHRECSCSTWDKPCRNRVVQRGVNVLLEVYKCSDEKGFGVRAAEPIPEQTFICEYAGEVLDKEEVEERAMFKHDHNYTLTVQEHGAGGVITTFIDPRRRGNLARFINHGCQPNLSMAIVRIGYTVPHIALFSNRKIHVGEELCYDYGVSALGGTERKRCLCGSTGCRGYLPMSSTASE